MRRLLPFLLFVFPTASVYAEADACVATARQLIAELLPFAEQIAGKPLPVVAPRHVALLTIAPAGIIGYQETAHVFGAHIEIHPHFCRRDKEVQAAIIAHELGHLIDGQSGQMSPAISAAQWADRTTEIGATRHAIEIFRRAGKDVAAFRREYQVSHLEHAGLARTPEDAPACRPCVP